MYLLWSALKFVSIWWIYNRALGNKPKLHQKNSSLQYLLNQQH
uniref:Uncharacterized protein n=1 Tax=Rhizophora mucronata TaxID=61149 RepID=A0A2P2QC89_RHIMU